MQFTIKQSQLKAMLNLASKQDIRYYLNGVFVEFNQVTTRLIATDGHKLGVLNHAPEYMASEGAGSMIIPREVIENLPKAASDFELTFIKSDGNATGWTIVIPGGTQIVFQQIEGTFPDYRRVCNFKTSGEAASFNYEYLVQFLKVQKALGGSKTNTVNLYQNGTSGALVTLAGVENFAGVIMPMRNDVINQAGAMMDNELLKLLPDTSAGDTAAAAA
jgi:DNA polymerase-3 subunit beta